MKDLFQSFMAPDTDWGKSLRDAIFTAAVVGFVAALESIDTKNFGEYAPFVAAMISFVVARSNRYVRKKPNKRTPIEGAPKL